MGLRQAFGIWQARQKADGCLASVLVVAAFVPMARFFLSPSPASAWVMGIFFLALGMACVRLLNSAARVVRIRQSLSPGFVPKVVDAEILDVYEHPGRFDVPSGQSINVFWFAAASCHPAGKTEFPSPEESASPMQRIIRLPTGNQNEDSGQRVLPGRLSWRNFPKRS